MNQWIEVQCPHCFELVEMRLESDVWGDLVMDCEVCCNPWQVKIKRDYEGEAEVLIAKLE